MLTASFQQLLYFLGLTLT
uniref:Uncharacterized protein n=1 Tax=Rhizophora mucronata TaxID=61149 RepID=A0A2P2Q032_RHIMU